MIRVDTTGQQSVCLSSGQRQEAGQRVPGSSGMEWTPKVLIQVKLHNTYMLVSTVHRKPGYVATYKTDIQLRAKYVDLLTTTCNHR